MSRTIHPVTRRYVTEDCNLRQQHCENLSSCRIRVCWRRLYR